MTGSAVSALRCVGSVLIDPVGAHREAARRPRPLGVAAALLVGLALLGAATLPRQLALLERTLGSTGDPMLDVQQALMRAGLLRLIVADRLVPSPTLVVTAVLIVAAAEPILALARDRRSAIWTIALVGLAPLVVERIGELAITYVLPFGAHVTPGDAVSSPHRFVTGPLLFWRRSEPAPGWLELLNQHVNIISLWCVAIWTIGLRELDGRKLAPWHIVLPAACLIAAGVLTRMLTPLVLGMLLGRP